MNLIIYPLDPAIYVELKNHKRIKFSRQKTDELLSSFKSVDSACSRFADIVASDPILRILFFLKSEKVPNLNPKYPVSEIFPLLLNPKYDFQKLNEGYSKEKEAIEKEHETLSTEVSDVYSSVSFNALNSLLTDKEVIRSLRKRDFDLKKALDESYERHQSEVEEVYSTYLDKLISGAHDISLLSDLLDVVKSSEIAKNNGDILSRVTPLPENSESFFASLNKLASKNIVTIGTNSLCLDCYFKFKDEPYQSQTYNIKTLNLQSECPTCKQKGI